MKARTPVFIASSLDGYISRRDGSIDWLEANAVVPNDIKLGLASSKACSFGFVQSTYRAGPASAAETASP